MWRNRLQDISPHVRRFAPYVRRFASHWDVSAPIETFRPPGKTFRPLSKLRHFDPSCETFRPHSYRMFRTLGKSFHPRCQRTFRTLLKIFLRRSQFFIKFWWSNWLNFMSCRIGIATPPPTPRPGYSVLPLLVIMIIRNPYFTLFPDFSLLSCIFTNCE